MEPQFKVGDYVKDYRTFYEVTRIEPNTGYGKEEYPYMFIKLVNGQLILEV